MANVGDKLITPESGMQRVDNTDNSIIYGGSYIKQTTTNDSYYKNTRTYLDSSSSTIDIYFYGTKLYFIGDCYSPYRVSKMKVQLDNNPEEEVTLYSTGTKLINNIVQYTIDSLEEKIHHIKFYSNQASSSTVFILDAIDIDEDGYLCTEVQYEIQEAQNRKFPVMIGDDTITSETNIANYASELTNGERQLLVAESLEGLYVTDGKGGYNTLITENKNKDVLDLLTTDGTDLYFKGRNVHKIELQDGQYGYSTTFMNTKADSTYSINITDGSMLCDQIVQAWEFEEGLNDVTTVAKTFDNANTDNFFYDDNIAFTDNICKVKDEFELGRTLDSTSGLYESEIINKDNFVELINIYDKYYIDDSLETEFSDIWDLSELGGAQVTNNSNGTAISPTANWNDYDSNVAYLRFNNKKMFNFRFRFTPTNISQSLGALNFAFRNNTNENFSILISDGQGNDNSSLSIILSVNNNKIVLLNNFSLVEHSVEIKVVESDILFYVDNDLKYTLSKDSSFICNNLKASWFRYSSSYNSTLFYLKDLILEDYYYIKKDNNYYNIKDDNYDSNTGEYNAIAYDSDNMQDNYINLKELNTEKIIDSETFKPLDKFDNFKIVSSNENIIKIQGLKADKGMVVGRYSFSTRLAKNIDFFELVSTISDDSSIKMAVSIDTGTKWKVYNGTDWVDLTNTCPLKNYADMTDDEKTKWEAFRDEVFTSGMDAKTLNTIDFNGIKDGTMMFAYAFDRNSYADSCEMNKLQYQFDANGSYRLLGNDEVQIGQNASAISIVPKIDMDLVKVNVGSSGEVTINQGGGEIMITEEEYQEDWSEIFG